MTWQEMAVVTVQATAEEAAAEESSMTAPAAQVRRNCQKALADKQ